MRSSRLSARLSQLPHDVLAELAAQLCSESPAQQAAAEECMAAHNPLPHEMVERVLLSPDLVPHILGPLVAEDGAAAAVCSQWLVGWKATNEPRRRLKQVPLDFPQELATSKELHMSATPDGRLVLGAFFDVHILDRSMLVLQTMARGTGHGSIAANDDSIFRWNGAGAVRRSTHEGTLVAEYHLEGYYSSCPVLAPGGLLFCVISKKGVETDLDEIIALDAQTMQLRHRFGLGLFNSPQMLVVLGDELYVCDTGNHCLQVFSLAGEHRRSVTGEWRSPQLLYFAKDRLYLIERKPEDEEEDSDEDDDALESINPLQGRRILVLSLQGDILQVVTHPTEPTAQFTSVCYFDHKLLVSYLIPTYYLYTESAGNVRRPTAFGMFALQGL